ncbi:hypothetical protein BURKHO8Y_20174 [Burkholderia sp. 8Y]|uniref:CYTH domain-containing protein n=1 Tax=Burkholderia sp. 8Y TaxID=2653133 RepID=UPI0012F30171|nr:CYTH domain-containing protein [Burkholderia sp. 8Y]VXC19177.1 hypothetical protein BURKHO8Y_20174 [Burkholderia sp. 8Y]
METQLKLLVTSGKASQVMHAPAVSRLLNGPVDATDLVSTYFDTPEMHLRKHGASLRVRVVGEQRLQTLKMQGSTAAGLFVRDEFECPVNGDGPDLDALLALIPKTSEAIDILSVPDVAGRLEPLFLTASIGASRHCTCPAVPRLRLRWTMVQSKPLRVGRLRSTVSSLSSRAGSQSSFTTSRVLTA